MNVVKATRQNYDATYSYFVNQVGWQIQTDGNDFSIQVASLTDTTEMLQAWVDNHAVLTVNCTQPAILADGVTSTLISVSNGQAFSFRVLRYNIEIHADNADGVLEFTTTDPAEYLFELKQGEMTGYCKVVAHD